MKGVSSMDMDATKTDKTSQPANGELTTDWIRQFRKFRYVVEVTGNSDLAAVQGFAAGGARSGSDVLIAFPRLPAEMEAEEFVPTHDDLSVFISFNLRTMLGLLVELVSRGLNVGLELRRSP